MASTFPLIINIEVTRIQIQILNSLTCGFEAHDCQSVRKLFHKFSKLVVILINFCLNTKYYCQFLKAGCYKQKVVAKKKMEHEGNFLKKFP